MEINPLISVIIPCFNQGNFIHNAIESALQQTYANIEILIVDDGSTDKSTLIELDSIKHPKITVLRKENGHLASARNYGIKQAKGKFIVTLDADDKLYPDFIEKTFQIIVPDDKVAAVSSWAQHFGIKKNIKKLYGGGINQFLLENSCTSCALIKKHIWEDVGGYDENMKSGYEDWEFWISVTKRGYRIHVIPETLFYYRIRKGSMISETLNKRPAIVRYIVDKHKETYIQFLPEIMYEKEVEMLNIISRYQNSSSYRLGRFLLSPLIFFKKKLSKR